MIINYKYIGFFSAGIVISSTIFYFNPKIKTVTHEQKVIEYVDRVKYVDKIVYVDKIKYVDKVITKYRDNGTKESEAVIKQYDENKEKIDEKSKEQNVIVRQNEIKDSTILHDSTFRNRLGVITNFTLDSKHNLMIIYERNVFNNFGISVYSRFNDVTKLEIPEVGAGLFFSF